MPEVRQAEGLEAMKGFLRQDDPNAAPRMTRKQKDQVLRGVRAACDLADQQMGPLNVGLFACGADTVARALEVYPDDRSCYTCDHLHGLTCQVWKEEPPPSARETGCNQHQEDGVPF